MVNLPKRSAVLAAVATALLGSAAYGADVNTIATGLNNPRALAFDQEGNLYVAEAGLGAGDGSGGAAKGIGLTGAITEIHGPSFERPYSRRVVTGLASVENLRGEVTGPDGISIRDEKIYIIETESTTAQLKDLLSSSNSVTDKQLDTVEQFGKLLTVKLDGEDDAQGEHHQRHFETVAAVGDIDYAWTDNNQGVAFAPPGQFPDANPYAVLALSDHRQYVADAGSNTVDEVLGDGSVRIVAYLPNPPVSDAVPTCIAQGSDHKLYVGTLAIRANFAAKKPQSKVFRFDPEASSAVQMLSDADVWASGFFPITGCGFGVDGFYVTEYLTSLAPPGGGDVVRIAINGDGSAGTRTHFGVGTLDHPNGFAASPEGWIYVSNKSISANGSVVRIKP